MLRMKYKTAYEAYRSCVSALVQAGKDGDNASDELLQNEAKALRELTEARAALLAAISGG
jgi:hypothetical protein